MTTKNTEHFTPEVLAFVVQARRFCEFTEQAGGFSLSTRLQTARLRLLELYRAGSLLPQVEASDGVDAGPNPPTPRSWLGFEDFELTLGSGRAENRSHLGMAFSLRHALGRSRD